MQAKALRLSGEFNIDALTLDTIDVPEPGPHEVLVRVRAVSLNYRDLLLVQGHYDPHVQKPRILCSDGAGDVVSVGADVHDWAAGDRVVAPFFLDWIDGPANAAAAASALGGAIDGMLSQYRVVPASALVRVPDGMSFDEAATFPCAAVTAWNALVSSGGVTQGDTVLLQGTGGVSIFALQIAKLRGATTIVTSSSDAKLEQARALGADHTINYRSEPAWDKRARDLTGGAGVTHVVEVGGAGTLPMSLRAAAVGAQISVIGVLTGLEQPLNIGNVLMKSLRLQGIYVGSRAMLQQALEAFATSGLHPVVNRTFPLDEGKDALRYLASAQHVGKIVITLPPR